MESYYACSFVFHIFFAQDYDDLFSLLYNNNGKGIDCLYHNLFIPLTVDGHGLLRVCGNYEHSGLCVLHTWVCISVGHVPHSGMAGSQAVESSTFLGDDVQISKEVAPIYRLPSRV